MSSAFDEILGMTSAVKTRHRWTRDEDLVVAGMYLLTGTPNQPKAVKERLADLFGCPITSVPMRFANVDAYLGNGKLTSVAQQTKDACDELSPLTLDEVKRRTEAAYDRLTSRRGTSS